MKKWKLIVGGFVAIIVITLAVFACMPQLTRVFIPTEPTDFKIPKIAVESDPLEQESSTDGSFFDDLEDTESSDTPQLPKGFDPDNIIDLGQLNREENGWLEYVVAIFVKEDTAYIIVNDKYLDLTDTDKSGIVISVGTKFDSLYPEEKRSYSSYTFTVYDEAGNKVVFDFLPGL